MHEIESELVEFCSVEGSEHLVLLIKKSGHGFSVRSKENKHLWIVYEGVYVGLV